MDSTINNVAVIIPSVIKTQPDEENENFKKECITKQNDRLLLHCKNCKLLTFKSSRLADHNCNVEEEKILCPGYFLCKKKFNYLQPLKIHLQYDHKVNDENELEQLLSMVLHPRSNQNYDVQIVDDQLLKKSDNSESVNNQSKSKIFIKDVTLLRKPELGPATHINLPNIFDHLDLTTEDDIFDDFLATDNEPDDFDFDFEEPAINNEHDDEIITIPEQSAKIFVRKNLCNETSESCTESSEVKSQNKIYVRSHESLTNQIVATDINQQPSESTTPDCVIVSAETEAVIKESPTPNKIFIRNIETLTNHDPINSQFYDTDVANNGSSSNFLNHPSSTYVNTFPPSIYVRSYDSLVNEAATASIDNNQRCKISIKNMDTLIEPSHPSRLMNPPFGQNLVIHMRTTQNSDESLMNFRNTSVTPGSSNVSICGGNDNDVIILDELNESSFLNYSNEVVPQVNVDTLCKAVNSEIEKDVAKETSIVTETNAELENPERNQTPNDKPKIDTSMHDEMRIVEDQPMTRIPLSMTNKSSENGEVYESFDVPKKKKMKIIKIVRVKKKKISTDGVKKDPLANVQVIFKCNIAECSLSFSNPKLLNYHKRCHFNDGVQIVCPECKIEEFKNFNTLHTHLWRHHGIDMDLFACSLCNFKTPFLSRLKNFHEKIHSDEKNYKCEFLNCNKKFCNSKQLQNHSQIHKTTKKKMKKNLQSICISSSEIKRIKCQICNKGFASESGLYIHFSQHKNDEKRFICEEKSCQYSTNDHNSFRRHKFQHTKSHQYSCPACNYVSIQSNTYRKHLEKQHKELAEELLYRCNSCKFITISKSKYDGHISKHLADS